MAKTNEATVREAVGVFRDATQVRSAIDELQQAGFERSQFGIVASEAVVKEQLDNFYQRASDTPEPDKSPATAFVSRDSDSNGEAGEAVSGSLNFVGSSGLAGAIVATAAVLGGPLTIAVGGIVGVGLVGMAVGSMINQSAAEVLQQSVDEGHILLFVRLPHGEREQQAMDILTRHNATEVKVHEVPIKQGEQVTADVLETAA